MREWKKREGNEGDACNRLGKVKGKGIERNGAEEKEVNVVDGRKQREAKEKESRKGMEYVGKGKKVKGWKGKEERGKGREKKGIKVWNLRRKVRNREKGCKEMDKNRREWMGQMERNMVKGCKEMNGREGRGLNVRSVRDGMCWGRKRDGRK